MLPGSLQLTVKYFPKKGLDLSRGVVLVSAEVGRNRYAKNISQFNTKN